MLAILSVAVFNDANLLTGFGLLSGRGQLLQWTA